MGKEFEGGGGGDLFVGFFFFSLLLGYEAPWIAPCTRGGEEMVLCSAEQCSGRGRHCS